MRKNAKIEIIEKFIEQNIKFFKFRYIKIFKRDITQDEFFNVYIYLIFINVSKNIIFNENRNNFEKMANIFNNSYWMDYKYFVFIVNGELTDKIKKVSIRNRRFG